MLNIVGPPYNERLSCPIIIQRKTVQRQIESKDCIFWNLSKQIYAAHCAQCTQCSHFLLLDQQTPFYPFRFIAHFTKTFKDERHVLVLNAIASTTTFPQNVIQLNAGFADGVVCVEEECDGDDFASEKESECGS